MAIDINGETLIITLDPVVNGVLDVDVGKNLYTAWKTWVKQGNMRYPAAFRTTGGDELTSIIDAGAYYFLRNDYGWRIRAYENDGTYYTVGNLAVQDTRLPAFIPTIGGYTAAILGLQPVTQGVSATLTNNVAFAAFGGGVSIDINSPYDITTEGAGNLEFPVNNFQDADTIAASNGFRKFFVLSNASLIGASLDFSDGHKFIGFSPVSVALTIDTSISIQNCEFIDLYITGVLDGNSVIRESVLGTLNYVNGFIYNCTLGSKITLGGNANASIKGCWQEKQSVVPEIDMGGVGQQLSMPDYHGEVLISNCTGIGTSYISGVGKVTIDSSIISGTFIIYGGMSIEHTQTGSEVVIDRTTSAETWREPKALTVGKYLGLK